MKPTTYIPRLSSPASGALLLPLLLALLLAACADTADPPETATEDTLAVADEPPAPADAMGDGVYLDVAEQTPYGQYLTDAEGRALYLFTADTPGQSSTCTDACANAWPPLLTETDAVDAAPTVDTAMIGTIEREDGSLQVTYNGWPLYYFQQDTGAGMVEGQDVEGFGGEWYLISPQGEQIEAGES